MKAKNYFPMFIDLEDKKIVVAGGGKIATRRVKTLVSFANNITVIAPMITDEIDVLFLKGKIQLERRKVQTQDFDGAFMVLAATDDGRLNDDIANYCKHQGIYVNISSDKNKCDFHFPGIVKKEEVIIGINAGGVNHKKAKLVRKMIEQLLSGREQKSSPVQEGDSKNGKKEMDYRKQRK